MVVLTWVFAVPLVAWMAAAGLGALTGHTMATETFDRLGYSARARALAGITELLTAVGVFLGAAFADHQIAVAGVVAANLITALTWFVIGHGGASRTDKVGAWLVTALATAYLIILMVRA